MRLSRLALSLVLLALATSGCIENMGDLKEALGVEEPVVPAALPDLAPPLAKAQANATTALVGVPVRFMSEGTRDPQELPLTMAWDFGDGAVGAGAIALHAYTEPGERLARLTVTNAAGLSDEDTIAIRVLPRDGAPTAEIRILDADGFPAARALAGDALTFHAIAADPERAPLTLDWDMGDGRTSHDASLTHAYAAPGAYDVRLTATDASGQSATATARVLVDGAWRAGGAFEPAGADAAETSFAVPRGARALTATLAFPAQLGLHDLEIVLLDAAGEPVATSAAGGEPGAQGEATREIALDAEQFASARAGAWTARVVREVGAQVEWTLTLRVAM